jgi:hypothetical protein
MPPSLTPSELQTEEDFYADALAELDTGARRPGLWAKCFAATNGAEPDAKAMYLRERVQQLQAALEAGRAAEAVQRAAAAAMAREAHEALTKAFLSGKQLTVEDVRQLAAAAKDDPSLATLSERFRGDTLLHWAARHDLIEESRRLLALGADPCVGNAKAQRPHMLAPSKDVREVLLDAVRKALCLSVWNLTSHPMPCDAG